MKSRTSSSKVTALRKDVTRFAPLWVLYIVGAFLGLLMVLDLYDNITTPRRIASSIAFMGVVNMIYALLAAQLLFGDLFSSRMCNAIHALPLRREDWFATHTLSGLLFAFVPHLLFTLITLPFMGKLWTVSFWWMLAADLQFLFFFGVAIFCVFCTGSRFAAVVVYGILNFLSILAWWFADVLYQPLLYGLDMDSTIFQTLCPVVQMCSFDYLQLHRSDDPILPGSLQTTYEVWYNMGDGWGYLATCAVIGIVLGAIGLMLYRKRDLEKAGDFITVRFLEPVFLVLFSLTVGAMFQLMEYLFISEDGYLFLFVGIAVGFYLGRMLLLRTTRVFQPRSFFALASLMGLLLASIGFIGSDVLGIISWVPEASEVKSITVTTDYYSYYMNGENYFFDHDFTADSPEEIAVMLQVHEGILADRENDPYTQSVPNGGVIIETEDPDASEHYTRIDFIYKLYDGRSVHRYYQVGNKSDAAKTLNPYFSSVEAVLGKEAAEDFDSYASNIMSIYVSGMDETSQDPTQIRQLLDAIAADCEAGHMTQDWAFHSDESSVAHIELYWQEVFMNTPRNWSNITIFPCAENTVAWLEANGVELWE